MRSVAATDAAGTRSSAGTFWGFSTDPLTNGQCLVEDAVHRPAVVGEFTHSQHVTLVGLSDTLVIGPFVLKRGCKLALLEFVTDVAVTTGGKGITLGVRKRPGGTGGTPAAVTAGLLTLTSALCTPVGAAIEGAAVTDDGKQSFAAGDAFDLIVAANVAAFSEGSGTVIATFTAANQ